MHQSLTILAALACSVSGQSVISYYYPGGSCHENPTDVAFCHLITWTIGYEGAQPVATIETANPSTTQFKIACPTDADASDCGFGPGVQYKILSSTRYEAALSSGGYSVSYGCDYNSQITAMTCTVNQKGIQDGLSDGPQTAVLSGTDVVFNSATIVEGASLLNGGGHASPTASPKSVSASASSGSTPIGTHASNTAASKTGVSQSSATATGAAVRSGFEGATFLTMVGAVVMILL